MKKNAHLEILDSMAQAIFDKKGMNILVLDVRGLSTMTDYYIIAEGTVDRHVRAISQAVIHAAKEQKTAALHVEGEKEGDWIVIDFGDVIIHLFTPDLREKYALESLWSKSTIVDVQIDVSPPAHKLSHKHH
jgi:ribosome-associated protein